MIVLADEPAAGRHHLDQAVTPVPNVSVAAGRTTGTTGTGAAWRWHHFLAEDAWGIPTAPPHERLAEIGIPARWHHFLASESVEYHGRRTLGPAASFAKARVSRVGRHPDRPSEGILGLPFLATEPPAGRIGLIEASATRLPAAWVYVTEQ